jgi:chorismate mutase/prephenate dehydratase
MSSPPTAALSPHAAPSPAAAAAAAAARPLPVLRAAIDAVDTQIVALLNARAALVVEVGQRKIADGTPVYAPHREQAVLARVLALNSGPLLSCTLESVYREIMSGSFALERPLRIGFLGPPGSFSHDAAAKQFGASVSYENLRAIDGVFEEVARGHVDYGLVPVENPSIGSVVETLDSALAFCSRVSICAEVQLSVCQALIAAPGAVPSDVREIHSKPEALAQCRRWLATQYPHAAQVASASTSAAVAHVAALAAASGARHVAAVGCALAAKLHGDLPVMFSDIQDNTPNITRFLVLCAAGTPAAATSPSGDDKTSFFFVCGDRAGALASVLDCFRRHEVNLTHIDKRPCSPERLVLLVNASDKRRLLSGSDDGASAEGGSGGGGSGGGDDAAAGSASAPAPVAARAPSPTSLPAALGAPSLHVPAMLGGRGGLAQQSYTYVFLVEAQGHLTEAPMRAALAEAALLCTALKVLGSFPRARRVL